MIISWMLYTLLVSALLAAGARCMEEVSRAARRPARVVWLSALLMALVLAALAPHRAAQSGPAAGSAPAEPVSTAELSRLGVTGDVESVDARWYGAAGPLRALRQAVHWPLRAAAPLAGGRVGHVLGLAWLILAAALLMVGAGTLLRYRAARKQWPVREIAGTPVRVAPAAGPAVLGLLRPEIVVPEWLLAASPEEQRLVVLHEREHVRAGDPLTLIAGWLAVALVPWNPVAWWTLSRLRAAVELDCDARVLHTGVGPRSYGSMLIDIAGRGSGLSLGVTALAGSRSTLERRLLAMSTATGRTAALRAAAVGVLGTAALLAACETRMLTAVEIDELDVAAVEARAEQLELIPDGQKDVTYFIDEVRVSPDDARGLAADEISQVEVVRGLVPAVKIVRELREERGAAFRLRIKGAAATRLDDDPQDLSSYFEEGLLIIDGKPAPFSSMRTLNMKRVESISILKGAAATRLYDDPRAANGVVLVTTKDAADR